MHHNVLQRRLRHLTARRQRGVLRLEQARERLAVLPQADQRLFQRGRQLLRRSLRQDVGGEKSFFVCEAKMRPFWM
mgnify:CR=1 FL=1